MVMAAIVVAHIAVIASIQWTTTWFPEILIAAVDSADLIAIIAIVNIVARALTESTIAGQGRKRR
jgi:hypothetical protein